MTGPLSGRGILITRPAHQALASLESLAAAGATTWQLGALDISASEPEGLDAALARFSKAEFAIFVSANAAEHGLAALARRGIAPPGPAIAAIGSATRALLAAQGVETHIQSDRGEDSESLLAHPALADVRGKTILIFRGSSEAGGRALLKTTLTERGAEVVEAVCYARRPAQHDPALLAQVHTALNDKRIHAVQAMSVESLDALTAALGRTDALLDCLLLVPHPRIAAAATERGFRMVQVADLGDDAIVRSVVTALQNSSQRNPA